MSRSVSYLCRGLLGIACAGALGFGTTQAFATPAETSISNACKPDMVAYCEWFCPPPGGYCTTGPGGPMCACY
jgi:hypothetical protein